MLENFSKEILRKIISQYNLHVGIKGFYKFSKEDLIKHIHSKLTYEDGELVIKPNINKIDIEKIKDNIKNKRVSKKTKPIVETKPNVETIDENSLNEEQKERLLKAAINSFNSIRVGDQKYYPPMKLNKENQEEFNERKQNILKNAMLDNSINYKIDDFYKKDGITTYIDKKGIYDYLTKLSKSEKLRLKPEGILKEAMMDTYLFTGKNSYIPSKDSTSFLKALTWLFMQPIDPKYIKLILKKTEEIMLKGQ
jgi:hypothetical protein